MPGVTRMWARGDGGPVSGPDKWANADSSLSHSQMELGLKSK